jgi:SAM-dependent methyltransferase
MYISYFETVKNKLNEMKHYYRTTGDRVARYTFDNKKRVSEIRALYRSHKKFFGKRVLDIGCGGGILGFVIEPYNHIYTGIDANQDAIESAKQYARELKSKNRFILGDVIKKNLRGKFDTIVFIGNGLCHLNTHEFLGIIQNIRKNIRKGTYFIVDYRDVVRLLFNKEWKDRMKETSVSRPMYSITTGADMKTGTIFKKGFEEGKRPANFTHTIWSPFIIEPMMNASGWRLVKRKQMKRWQGWIDVYRYTQS